MTNLPHDLEALAASEIPTEDDLFELLRDVVDPELGINVVDLGLVYGVHMDEIGRAHV